MNHFKYVLLVEDNEHDTFFFTTAIRRIENAILLPVASNGPNALVELSTSTLLPDLIFMDINMPGMSGIECLEEIVKNPGWTHIPVVMLSTSIEEVEQARSMGARAFLQKTCDQVALHANLAKMINLDFVADSNIAEQTFETALLAA